MALTKREKETREQKAEIEQRLREALFVDLLQSFLSDPGGDRMTAAEVFERRREIFMRVGPVLQRLDPDYLKPVIKWR